MIDDNKLDKLEERFRVIDERLRLLEDALREIMGQCQKNHQVDWAFSSEPPH